MCGSRREPSRTRALTDRLARYASAHDPTTLDLREYDLPVFDGRDPAEFDASTREAVEALVAADVLLLASPVYFAGYSGALKNLFDHTPYERFGGTRRAAGLVMCGRDERHRFVLDAQLRPLLVYLGVDVATRGVFATEADFDGFVLDSLEVDERLEGLVEDAVSLWRDLGE